MVSKSLSLSNHILLSWTSFNHSYSHRYLFSVYIVCKHFSVVWQWVFLFQQHNPRCKRAHPLKSQHMLPSRVLILSQHAHWPFSSTTFTPTCHVTVHPAATFPFQKPPVWAWAATLVKDLQNKRLPWPLTCRICSQGSFCSCLLLIFLTFFFFFLSSPQTKVDI